MTVCIAALFNWLYQAPSEANPAPVIGPAVVAATDNMLTAPDGKSEFESGRAKAGLLSARCIVMAAGEMTIHAQAIRDSQIALRDNPEASPENSADTYGLAISSIKGRSIERQLLSPWGMTLESFVKQGSNAPPQLANRLDEAMAAYSLDAEALVAGCSPLPSSLSADIYHVDCHGIVSCLSDLGFGAIGLGADAALSHYRLNGYAWHMMNFYQALTVLFAAKKAAETAPGVGQKGWYYLITAHGVSPIMPDIVSKLEEVYQKTTHGKMVLDQAAAEELEGYASSFRNEFFPDFPIPPQPMPDPEAPKADA